MRAGDYPMIVRNRRQTICLSEGQTTPAHGRERTEKLRNGSETGHRYGLR